MILNEPLNPDTKEVCPGLLETIQRHRYQAQCFVFDDETVVAIATLFRDHPELFIRNWQFAMLPAEGVTYIEYNNHLFLRTLGVPVFEPYDATQLASVDIQVGIMLAHNTITYLARDFRASRPCISLIQYTYDHAQPSRGMARMRIAPSDADEDGYRMGQHIHLLGATYLHEAIDEEIMTWLDNKFDIWWTQELERKYRSNPTRKERRWGGYAAEFDEGMALPQFVSRMCRGELRTLLCLLLWLNQQRVVYHDYVAPRRALLRGRPVTYMKHHVVRLKKNVTQRQMRSVLSDRAPPRRHEVRPFWRNKDMQASCQHSFPMDPDEKGHFICKGCGGKRFPVKSFPRGDASRGFITKEYKV